MMSARDLDRLAVYEVTRKRLIPTIVVVLRQVDGDLTANSTGSSHDEGDGLVRHYRVRSDYS